MNILKTDIFNKWLKKLKDKKAKALIQVHINRLIEDKIGTVRSLGRSIHEKKISYGPGYRLYFINYNQKMIILLCGGDKSTQQDDIQRAKSIAKEVLEQMKEEL